MNAGCVETVTLGRGAITEGGPLYPWLIFFGNRHKLRTSSSEQNAIFKGYYEP